MPLPANAFALGLILGLAAAIILAPIVFLVFNAIGVASLRFWPFVIFKAVFAAMLAGIIMPIVVKRSLVANA